MEMSEQKRGHFIREWRKFRNLSQAELAERMGISREYVSLVENGKRRYDQLFLEAAAQVLSGTPADLIMRDPAKSESIWSIWEKIESEDREKALRILSVFINKNNS